MPLKGLDFSLKALKKLKKDFPNMHLIVIGLIKKGGHTEKLIKKLGLEKGSTGRRGASQHNSLIIIP